MEAGAVAHAPDEAFGDGGHELAMDAQDAAVRPEVGERVVEAAFGVGVALVDAKNDVGPGLLRRRADLLRGRGGDFDRVLMELQPGVGAAHIPERVGWNPGLRKDDEVRAVLGRFRDEVAGFVDGGLAVHELGGGLDGGGGELGEVVRHCCGPWHPSTGSGWS